MHSQLSKLINSVTAFSLIFMTLAPLNVAAIGCVGGQVSCDGGKTPSQSQQLDKSAAGSSSGGSSSGCTATDGTCADCSNNSGGCNIGCSGGTCTDPAADPDAACTKGSCDLIKKYLNPLINLLSVTFGLIAVISIILGGIQYSASEGDPQKTAKAKARITLTIFAIVAYFFMYSFLQFLVPGGIFNRTS